MATYGKKKRSLLSGFSVFRDDQPSPAVPSRARAPTRLDRAKSALQKSKGHQRSDDDSADELADDPLLHSSALQPMRSSLQSDTPDFEDVKSKSKLTAHEDRNKPLPPIPLAEPPVDAKLSKKGKTVLAPKSTNLKMPKKAEKLPARPRISNPILQDSEENYHNSALRAINGVPDEGVPAGLQTSVDDAENLSRKISSLMKQAAAREAEQASKSRDSSLTPVAKASPIQRSKIAISKATQAISDRLSNGGRRSLTSKARQSGRVASSPSSPVAFECQPDSKTNLAAIQPRDITGDSNIQRKPLPVYESMRSIDCSADPLQDPFSDLNQTNGQLSPEIQADFDFDFSKRKGKGKKPGEAQQVVQGGPFKNATVNSAGFQSPPRFSNKISGLAQHPNTVVFSTPPIGFSTPTDRLMPPKETPRESPLPNSAAHTPSILDFSFEESDEDDILELRRSEVTDRSLSVKRKSAKEDLRAQLSPLSKRAKNNSAISKNHMDLVTKLQQMDTSDSGPLIEKDENVKSNRPATADSKCKGLGRIENAVGPGSLSSIGERIKRPRARTTAAKRLSIPSPNSILFSRESRAHYRLRDTTDGDSLDVDELQMDEGGYKVRT